MQHDEAIEKIRHFNRTYLPFMSMLDQDYLGTGHPITDARVLFEIQDRGECSAREIVEALRIDKGYLSRILRRYESEGALVRTPSSSDRRVMLVRLTEKGSSLLSDLSEGGTRLVGGALAGATDEQCEALVSAMGEIEAVLADIRAQQKADAGNVHDAKR